MKITAVLLKLGQTRVIISPMSPKKNHSKERKEGKGDRAREKKTVNSLKFL